MTRQTPTPRMTVNCPACGTAYDFTPDFAAWVVGPGGPEVEVETADDGSGWFLTCPPNHLHADPERFAVTREDVS